MGRIGKVSIKLGESIEFRCPACENHIYLVVDSSDDKEAECKIIGFCDKCDRQFVMLVYPE